MTDTTSSADAEAESTTRLKTGALTGVRVLDLTSVVLGPSATQALGDNGADVIKIEGPNGDIMRFAEPLRSPGMGGVFVNINRNKRAIALDLKSEAGREVLLRLIDTADVFIHSMRPQAIARLGLDAAAVRARKPDIIYCATIGFSARGPYAKRPAYDDVIQGLSGFADLASRRSGAAPEFAPSIIADKIVGLTAYGAILTALYHRAMTGAGQDVEVPMFETMAAFNLAEHLAGHAFAPPAGEIGYARCLSPMRRPYATADGYMAVLPYSTRHWRAFFEAADRPELADDARIATPQTRSRHFTEIYGLVAEIMATETTATWTERLNTADVPSVAVNRLEDLADDPHLRAIAFFKTFDHPTEGRMQTTDVPVTYSATPGSPTHRPAPRHGEHTRAVLAEAGFAPADVERLIESGAAIAQ